MPFENLLVQKRDRVGIVIINRPEKMNALNTTTRAGNSSALSKSSKTMKPSASS